MGYNGIMGGLLKNVLMDPQDLPEAVLLKRQKLVFWGIGGVFVLLVIIGIVMAIVTNIPPTRIILNYSPESATVTINGTLEDRRVLDLEPGKYIIEVSKYGFETYEAEVDLERFETETLFAVLEPSTVLTQNWYNKSPADSSVLDGRMSHEYDSNVRQMIEEFPIVEKLPVKSSEFEIYYGDCGEGNCEIVIKSDLGRYDKAIQYFYRSLDSDIGKYTFTFINYGNQFQGERDGLGS